MARTSSDTTTKLLIVVFVFPACAVALSLVLRFPLLLLVGFWSLKPAWLHHAIDAIALLCALFLSFRICSIAWPRAPTESP